jgi:hypothetical protein
VKHGFDAQFEAGDSLKGINQKLFVTLERGEMEIIRAGYTQRIVHNIEDVALAQNGPDAYLHPPYFTHPSLPLGIGFFKCNLPEVLERTGNVR